MVDSETVYCPECDAAYHMRPELAGRKIRCRHCRCLFTAEWQEDDEIEIDTDAEAVSRWSPPSWHLAMTVSVLVLGLLILFGTLRGDFDWMAEGIRDVFGMVLLISLVSFCISAAIGVYFAPAIIAHRRRHPNFIPLLIVNGFFGWMIVLWILCLAWAFWNLPSSQVGFDRYRPDDRRH